MQLRRLAGLPNNGMDAETVAAVNMLLNHVTEQQGAQHFLMKSGAEYAL